MNGFQRASLIGAKGVSKVLAFIGAWAKEGRYVVTDKGRLAKQLQESVGDALFNDARDGAIFGVEIKAEQQETGNLFLESWSNLSRFKLGWMFTLESDLIFYYFIDTENLYVMSFWELRRWAFIRRRFYAYREVKQAAYDQLNDTYGRPVPIRVLAAEAGLRRYRMTNEGAVRLPIEGEQGTLFRKQKVG